MAQKTIANKTTAKKAFKKELSLKIESVLTELKSTLGEKEFHHRIKKATKVLAHGLSGKGISIKGIAVKPKSKPTAPKKIKEIKKAVAKKAVSKKTVIKKETPVTEG